MPPRVDHDDELMSDTSTLQGDDPMSDTSTVRSDQESSAGDDSHDGNNNIGGADQARRRRVVNLPPPITFNGPCERCLANETDCVPYRFYFPSSTSLKCYKCKVNGRPCSHDTSTLSKQGQLLRQEAAFNRGLMSEVTQNHKEACQRLRTETVQQRSVLATTRSNRGIMARQHAYAAEQMRFWMNIAHRLLIAHRNFDVDTFTRIKNFADQNQLESTLQDFGEDTDTYISEYLRAHQERQGEGRHQDADTDGGEEEQDQADG